MTTTGCPDENELGMLADSRLGEDERRRLEHHLDGCRSCSALLGELARLAPPVRVVPERYTIIRQLGAGGMGVVWEAEDRQLLRKVALKSVIPDPAATADDDRARRARVYREARALAQLHHPNVLAVYDVSEIGDDVFLALELVEGTTARVWRDAAARSPDDIDALWRQVGLGLAAVHRVGIVHRDVKPDNVLVAADGRVLLSDFGLATASHAETMTLTVTGQVMGTPLYMAPEQLQGEPATAKSDQFAVCVCWWEALAGARPFTGATTAALAVASLRSPAIPAHVDRDRFAVLARGLAADPAARWPDIDALLAALALPRRRSKRARSIGALVLVAAVSVLAGAVAWQRSSPPVDAASAPASSTSPVADAHLFDALDLVDALVDVLVDASATGAPPQVVTTIPPAVRPRNEPAVDDGAAHDDWNDHEGRVTDFIKVRDGKRCLAELGRIRTSDPRHLESAARYHATCTMLVDCAAGRAELERLTAGKNVDTEAARWCRLDAPPESDWPARAEAQLSWLAHNGVSCAPVLAFIQAHELVLPTTPAKELDYLHVRCMVNVHDCAGARGASVSQYLASANWKHESDAERHAEADRFFELGFPTCAR